MNHTTGAQRINARRDKIYAQRDKLAAAQAKRLSDAAPEYLRTAHALLNALYAEYPEKLPFYCRDAAQELLDVLDKVNA
jgi:hypothetical protein